MHVNKIIYEKGSISTLNLSRLKIKLFIMRTLFDKYIVGISIVGSLVLVLNYLNLFFWDLEKHEMIILINIAGLQGWVFLFRVLINLFKSRDK